LSTFFRKYLIYKFLKMKDFNLKLSFRAYLLAKFYNFFITFINFQVNIY